MHSFTSKLSAAHFRCVAPVGDWCGEAPVWCASQNALFWVDINRCLVHRYMSTDEAVRTWFFPEPVTALALTEQDDMFVVALASKVILWNMQSGAWQDTGFRLEGWPKVRLNDGRADPSGSFWIGSMRNNVKADGSDGEAGGTDGTLYRIDPDFHVTIWERDIGIANTLAWSPDGRKFYFGDTLANQVNLYDYDPADGSIKNKQPFFQDFSRGLPDGSVMDSQGYLWHCRVGGSCLVRIAPDGVINNVIEFPGLKPTSCTFGGHNLDILYVTSAALGTTRDRLAGGLFALEAGVSGIPENRFAAGS